MKKEFEKDMFVLKKQIEEIEMKYALVSNHKLFSAILEKLNVNKIELDNDFIENSNNLYLVEVEEDTTTISKVVE